ncbi:putative F-box/FBD/LRR-repeat protein At1g78760 isoform X1 [Gastrolobium bilobum]|uniref:putative F-box/FBD/LRR-repeat protein At1g78760 isoform X1 n=1 Tax=Gastrolobium bilobum TaxID=150636 RepID=UPI002AB151F3|nr:putative F-box/FBD/LRR-repeat protein At1g78760 isoform X1 [Gastrolobium bilobum]XP_061371762.1 putative F-box/FBD/LRR-repeat protein At1g78760 isoform X1 [Gastrolobium bilobum]XP_061371763.1 putative F-box/FBD/LRR-repeat protein At1g78760 isoform X1 [Gastrolobium bilobum]XP_061371764.1 putative F-box/FBD/LRR-repeat protein At1g78760 isoform X1 [Gastrolobium bilobum]XP_061371765.1 putative F-box/FBD/LRR-repeat protein At1g78760 isoform X1 [Gastrolobium bilobum]XP_061371766.1 putative F-box/
MKRAKLSENNEDRLSDLPDCVLIHLMSFLPTQVAVQTCILSRRWKGLWKRLPTLILHYRHFSSMTSFNRFVPKVLSFRDDSVPLQHLEFNYNGRVRPHLLKRVLRYALSYDIQQLKLTYNCDLDLPPSLFLCQTLTSLDLTVFHRSQSFPKSLNLTALTSLSLYKFTFGHSELVEPFSSCIKLKTLVIHNCAIGDTQILCISNATLVNLDIRSYQAYKIVLSTPNLCSFAFSGIPNKHISASNLSSIKEVNIDADQWAALCHSRSGFILFSWLQLFANVRSLTLYSSTLQVLSSIPDLLNTEAPCFGNLKSLIVKVKNILPPNQRPGRIYKSKKAELKPVPDGVVDYLIRNSPFAEITIINC